MADSTKRIPRVINDNDVEAYNAMDELIIAKAKKEAALAQMAEIELSLATKHLIVREETAKAIFEASRTLRDRLLALSVKLAPELSNNSNAQEITKILKKSIEEQLREFVEELEAKI
ncbi:hypothetical protein C8R30_101156 [Nitrosomonas nitrosa]|uniref:hypothetical protein n=1 Tax=Nitrosomonas nitrosa TaxID=52442 RepID=UPI000D30D27B|nr:hypothetical protein [Nitrosomonas nitrosa]PTR04959.1 hypothetical protein C8R30_101156 [Nitrosomonas nitrosa]